MMRNYISKGLITSSMVVLSLSSLSSYQLPIGESYILPRSPYGQSSEKSLGDSLFYLLNPTHYRQREIEIEHADALNKKPILIGTEDLVNRRDVFSVPFV